VTAIVAASPAIDTDEEEAAYAVTVITIFVNASYGTNG